LKTILYLIKSMNKRFRYLVEKHLDNNLDEKENSEFAKFLEDPLCIAYLEKGKRIEKFIEEGFRLINKKAAGEAAAAAAAVAGKKGIRYPEADDIAEEVKEDILKYEVMKNPETVLAVKQMHQNMLNRSRNIPILIFSSAAAAILIGIAFFFLQPSRTSPQKLSKKYYKRYVITVLFCLFSTYGCINGGFLCLDHCKRFSILS
jgi:hypothetical protein